MDETTPKSPEDYKTFDYRYDTDSEEIRKHRRQEFIRDLLEFTFVILILTAVLSMQWWSGPLIKFLGLK